MGSNIRDYYWTERQLKVEWERNSTKYIVQFREGTGKFTKPFRKDGRIVIGAFYRVPIIDDGVKCLRLV